jgi:metal-responsive CopG/Arc/MetJ family transcriptional regulator
MEAQETRRINVIFPARLLEELDELTPPRKRSQIIVAATTDYVRRLKLLRAIQESAGLWEDASHPELATPKDIDEWVRQIRSHWRNEPLVRDQEHA